MAQATKARSTFRMEVGVQIVIDAPAERVWGLLTDAAEQARWNSTLVSIDGDIADGSTVRLTVKVAPDREFALKVSDVVPNRSMVWSDGFAPMFRGVRTFRLVPVDGGVRFEMNEVMSGLMLPMIARSLPDFGPAFETYAEDLKRAAEA
ncbi:MAG: hypothetical protein ACI8PZ_004095 [Myxococcota bacterium]|jgi:uncharacterized protein YndB with AHSA1/START domain